MAQAKVPVPRTTAPVPVAQEETQSSPLDDLTSQLQDIMSKSSSPVSGGLLGMDLSDVNSDVRVLLPIDEEGPDGQRTPIMFESQILEAKIEPASTGTPMLVIKLKTLFPVKHRGVTLYDNLALTQNARWRVKSLFGAVGGLDDEDKIAISESELPGYIVRHTLVNDTYNGQVRNKIGPSYMEAFEAPEIVEARGAEAAAMEKDKESPF